MRKVVWIAAFAAMTSVLICAISRPVFADRDVPVTARVTIAPEGQYGPIITANDQTILEGETVDFEVLATDANIQDSVTLELTQATMPWLGIVSNIDGNPAKMLLRASPPMGAIGRYRVFFTATDDSPYNLSTTKDIFIIVNPSNQPPVINAQNQVAQVGQTLSFTVNCRDPDNRDTVTLTYSGKPNWLAASLPTPSTGNPIDVTFTGTPRSTDEGTYTIQFNAVDDGSPQQSASKEVTIIVTRRNNPPVLEPIRDKEVPIRVTLEFAANANDPDGDPLTYSASGLPFSIGAMFNPTTRKFTWTAGNDQVGSYPVHFEVSDGIVTDSEDITVYISASDAPIFDPLFDKRVKIGKTLNFAITARDPNDDPITYGSQALPQGATFNPANQTFTWSPQPGQEGNHTVTFTASDGTYTSNKTLLITVQPVTAPELTPPEDKRLRYGQTLSFTLEVNDPDTPLNQLSYSVSNNPPGSALAGPNFTWTPTLSQIGTWRDIVFTVSDGVSSDSSAAWFFVLPNGAPVIEQIEDKHVVETRTLAFVVNATDPDADPLTYLQPLNAPKGSYFNPATRTFTWTPAIGERGIYNDVTFRVSDGVNTTEDVIWIVVDPNDAPIVAPLLDQHVKAGSTLSFGLSAYDPNGDDLTFKALNLPAGAVFEGQTFRWTPTSSQVGVYKDVLFEVSDGVNIVNVRLWLFVTEPGAPVMERIGDKFVTALETLTFTVNAADPDGDTLSYSAANLPQGSTFNPQTRTFTWTPTVVQIGIYPHVFFHVTDGIYTDTEECWIFVKGPGAPVMETPGDQRVRAGNTLEFPITADDPNTPAQNLVYSASNLPPGAVFSNQVFRWTPTTEQIGTYPDVTFTVNDGTYSDSKAIWLFVTSPNSPEFVEDIKTKDGKISEPLTFTILPADDPDNREDELQYYGINMPIGATFLNRTFRWLPQDGQEGAYKDVRLEVKDPDNNIDSDIFWIFVSKNRPPVLDYIGTKSGRVGQLLTFTVSATDPDNDPLTFSASNLPGGATFNPATRTFSWTPAQSGTYTGVHFEVSDGKATDSEDITIVVAP